MNTHIFVSYGHDEFTEKVRVIIKSLNKRKEYRTWWDGDLRKTSDWVRQIEENLNKLIESKPDSCFIYIVTPYSTSDERYNFCINEILRALEGRVRILPIRLSTAPMPLPIGSIQWFDMTQCKFDIEGKDFQQRIEALYDLIDSREPIKIDGKQGSLHRLLNPCQFTLDIDKHLQNYYPRQWLFEVTTDWLENRKDRMLLITGGPGTGKTAYSLWIATHKLPDKIHAWHLCQYNDANTCSLLTCVKSLTWYLASRLPYYYNSLDLSKIEEIVQGGSDNSGIMLKNIILENLRETHTNGKQIVILIDALDEASENGVNKVAEILSQYANEMPEWLRFIITTRNDISVTTPLKDVSYVVDLDEESNQTKCTSDIKEFIKANIDKTIIEKNKGIVDAIAKRSGNVILYAKLMCASIKSSGNLDINQLPKGLNSFYDAHIRRYFGSEAYNFVTHALPIIQLVLASFEPIKRHLIFQRLHDTEEWCKDKTRFKRVLDRFGPLLKEDKDYILPFHKSLSDWFIDESNTRFYVSLDDGYEKMSEWGEAVLSDEFSEDELAKHFYLYQPQYLIFANKNKELIRIFCDNEFWGQRKNILGIDLMFQRMFAELSLMSHTIKEKLFNSVQFRGIVHVYGTDLFNKGLFAQLKKIGFSVPINKMMNDAERMLALRYYYITEDYSTISNNFNFFNHSINDRDLESQVKNMLGLATKKCGLVSLSTKLFTDALLISQERKQPLERIIYYRLNLSRVLTILCKFEEGKRELKLAMDDFYNKDWRSSIKTTDFDFATRQLELAVRYVHVETELFSIASNITVCEKEIAWADDLYSSKLRRDRYYPRHLQSKILFLLRGHRHEEIKSIFDELNKTPTSRFDDICTNYYMALFLCATGKTDEGLCTATNSLHMLCQTDNLGIEKTEFFALVDTIKGESHLQEIKEDLIPWYNHMVSLIEQVLTRKTHHEYTQQRNVNRQ